MLIEWAAARRGAARRPRQLLQRRRRSSSPRPGAVPAWRLISNIDLTEAWGRSRHLVLS